MSQSQVAVGALLAGFVVYLGMNGKLAAYWKLLTASGTAVGGGIAPAATPANPNPGLTGAPSTPGALTGNPTTGFGFFPALGTILNPFTGQPIFPQSAPTPLGGGKS